ncbi:MAG: rhodanese-like domain-containing protein [Acidobacteriota bacterium]|jgi:membrane protein DedA with SNARE-associated domain/rhodanese-related sulfurtransferase
MEGLVPVLEKYDVTLLVGIVFTEALGFPVPAAPALLVGGAAVAKGYLPVGDAVGAAMGAMLAADWILYLLGQKTGWWLLGILCRLSMNPEACVHASAAYFQRRGRAALLFAKFFPGINTMAPPMAGSMKMNPWVFGRYNLGGTVLYVGTYLVLGYMFDGVIGNVVEWVMAFGRMATAVLASGLAAYFGYRIWRAARRRSGVKRVTVEELAGRLGEDIVIADARSRGYYDPKAERIPGSVRMDAAGLMEAMDGLGRGREVYVYCGCRNEKTSERLAEVLGQAGYQARVVEGGLEAWKKAGLPVEQVPAEEMMPLPRFV